MLSGVLSNPERFHLLWPLSARIKGLFHNLPRDFTSESLCSACVSWRKWHHPTRSIGTQYQRNLSLPVLVPPLHLWGILIFFLKTAQLYDGWRLVVGGAHFQSMSSSSEMVSLVTSVFFSSNIFLTLCCHLLLVMSNYEPLSLRIP